MGDGGDITSEAALTAADAVAEQTLAGASVAVLIGAASEALRRAADAAAARIAAGAPERLALARIDGATLTFGGLVDGLAAAIGAGDGLTGADRAAAVRARLESMAAEGRGVALVVDASEGLALHAASHLARLAAAGRRLTAERRAVEPDAPAVGVLIAAIGGEALEAAFAAESDPGLRRALESAVRLEARSWAAPEATPPVAPSWDQVTERERAAAAAAAPVFAAEPAAAGETAAAARAAAPAATPRGKPGLWPPSGFALAFGLGLSAVVGASVWEAITPPLPPLDVGLAPVAPPQVGAAPAVSEDGSAATTAVDAAFAEVRRRVDAGALTGAEGAVAGLRDAAAAAPGDPRVDALYEMLAARLSAAMAEALASGDFATARSLTAAAREAQAIAAR